MGDFAREILPITIEDELKRSYLDYAMSVIVGRALPDVRDGLKPVHRRVLYAMSELGNDWNKAYKKSARVVGDVIGKYHPHGESAVYDAVVRMAQPFSLRYMLVDGQGNFGSVDGDPPAAMRYTEVRMAKLAHSLLADLEKNTVDFVPNYDETEQVPTVLPTRIPNLLVNGSSGIAVGMATNVPPHNLTEIIDGCIALAYAPEMTVEQLMEIIPGPDFPTAGIINGRAGIVEAYRTGRGRIYVRARTEIETDAKSGKQCIIIKELPYQVNKARLIEKIAELVKLKKLEGITALRDESDKDGMRVVIELRRGESAEIVQNNLFIQTQMQSVFGINMVALVDGTPRQLSLKELLSYFLDHRREVVTRRTLFDLAKARSRTHLLEGLAVALANIDEVIALIKQAPSPRDAKQALLDSTWSPGVAIRELLGAAPENLTRPDELLPEYGLKESGYRLSPEQAQAILDLRLHRLTGLEQEKISGEYKDLVKLILSLLDILANPDKLLEVIINELQEVKAQFADARRSEIISSKQDLLAEDLIPDETVVVTVSREGYVKSQPVDTYQAQRRGGRGKTATRVKSEDVVEQMLIANTHDTILCFSSIGKVYWLRVFQLPQAGRVSRGKPIVNLLPLGPDETISAILPVRDYDEDSYIFMATANGTVKKTALSAFSRQRSSGIIALDLNENDKLVAVNVTNGKQSILLFTDAGKAIHFNEDEVRPVGRSARGVRGIKVSGGEKLISLIIAPDSGEILTATQNGYGKRTPIAEYRKQGRGGQGVIAIQVNERNGAVVAAIDVTSEDDFMLLSDKGMMIRTRADEVSVIGRNTQGVRLISLSDGESLIAVQRIFELEDEESSKEGEESQ